MEIKLEKVVLEYLERSQEEWLEIGEDLPLEKCQSPIEKLMFLSLNKFFSNFDIFLNRYIVNLDTQVKMTKNNFITDIELTFADCDCEITHKYAIECDGHDFHEKTKEQAAHDKYRERCIMAEGYTVIRFTGSEIVESPNDRAHDVWKIVKTDLQKTASLMKR